MHIRRAERVTCRGPRSRPGFWMAALLWMGHRRAGRRGEVIGMTRVDAGDDR